MVQNLWLVLYTVRKYKYIEKWNKSFTDISSDPETQRNAMHNSEYG